MNGMILGCCRRLKLPVERVYSVRYLSKLLWPRKSSEIEDDHTSRITEGFLEIAATITERAALARIWSPAEVEWQSARRLGAVATRYAIGRREGILTGYIMQIANADATRCLLVEDLLWGTLDQQERRILLQQLLNKAVAAGARMAIVPVLGYANMEPFAAARFRRSQRILHVYLSIWKDQPALKVLPSMYLDVF
jgi:hypothetical protein